MNALRIVFLVLAVGVLGLLGWRAVTVRGMAPDSRSVAPSPPPAIVPPVTLVAPPRFDRPPAPDTAADVPEFASFYARLKADFPLESAAIDARIAPMKASPNAAIWETLRDLEQSQGILAARAGAAALDRFFDARAAMLDGLAPLNARQCADFLYGMSDASIADFTAAHRGLVATLADRTLDAIADGRSHRDARAAPTEADLNALSTGLAARSLVPTEIGLLIDGTTPDPPPGDARLCDIGRIYLEVMRGLPADARQRIYGLAAELLARS